MNHYLRPWKLGTFAAGLALLLIGAELELAVDWDVGVSLAMALSTFLTAEYAARVLWERRWRDLDSAAAFAWWSVDGVYCLYWDFKNPAVLDAMRDAQWPCSLCLYLLCGFLWLLDDASAPRCLRNALADPVEPR